MKNQYQKLLRKIAHFQVEHPYIAVLLITAISLMIYGGVAQVETVASLEQMMPKDIEEIKAFNTLRDQNMGQDMVAIGFRIDRSSPYADNVMDVRDKRLYDYARGLKEELKKESDILEVHSFTDALGNEELNDSMYNKTITNPEVEERMNNFVNKDYTTSMMMVTTDVGADDARMNRLASKIQDTVDTMGHPPGIEVFYTGTPIIQQKLGELISKDRKNTKALSTVFVFILTMIVFGTLTSAFVPVIVVSLSVTWLYGTMGYTGLPISTLAGGVAAMVIGIGIDFAIHIINKFKYERRNGLRLKESVEMAVVETGTALTASSITTISAFLAFLFGAMPEMGRFGLLMAMGVSYSLIFTLFGLPTLLVLEEKLIYWIKKNLKFGLEGELRLKTNEEANEAEVRK